jgi:hypothetical protein
MISRLLGDARVAMIKLRVNENHRQSPNTNHQSPITNHQSPLLDFFGDPP